MIKNIAIICSGGDVSGMNPALKHFVEYSFKNNLKPYFVYNGYEGLIDDDIQIASYKDVAGIINKGGTIIGSARSKRFLDKKYRNIAYKNLQKHSIEMLVVLGGDGSMRGLNLFYEEFGIPFSAIGATIDNDINNTDYTLGVDTALNVIKNAIDSIRDTASSFKRAFIIETMGRECGYLALISHLTSGSELCLIPEVPYNLKEYEEDFKQQIQHGRNYFIVIASEGITQDTKDIAKWFEESLGVETRVSVLGHIQRGGNPTIYDRLMAYRFVHYAIDNLLNGEQNSVVCYTKEGFKTSSIEEVVGKKKELSTELLALL